MKTEKMLIEPEEILAEMTKDRQRMQNMPRTAPKIQAIKNIFLKVLTFIPPETKLPPVRKMAEALGVTIVPVQKVITELTHDGTLISKPRSGVFANKTPDGPVMPEPKVQSESKPSFCPFSNTLCFFTDSIDAHQKPLWQGIEDAFNKEYTTINVKIKYSSYQNITPDNKPDALECAGFGWQEQLNQMQLLPLKPFASAGSSLFSAGNLYGDYHIPLYFRTYYLLINPRLMKKHKIPYPAYTTFTDQLDYLQLVHGICTEQGLAPQAYAITEPVAMLGRYLHQFLDFAAGHIHDDTMSDKLITVFDNMLRYIRTCAFAPDDALPGTFYHDFLTEKSPFFIGYSNTLWEFRNRTDCPEWQTYPMLTADDKCMKWPILGVISSETRNPIEAVKFLSFLLRDECQETLTSNSGMIPSNGCSSCINASLTDAGIELFNQRFQQAAPFFLKANNEYYLANSVLNSSFWESRDSGRTGKDILESSLFLAKALNRAS